MEAEVAPDKDILVEGNLPRGEEEFNLSEKMTLPQFLNLRDPDEGFILGPRFIKLGSIQEDAKQEPILVRDKTGEYFFRPEVDNTEGVNIEWYVVEPLYYVDTEFVALDIAELIQRKEKHDTSSTERST